jgi:hypothetical protein
MRKNFIGKILLTGVSDLCKTKYRYCCIFLSILELYFLSFAALAFHV